MRTTSETIPMFTKNFQWEEGLFHLLSHQNDWFFHTNGKRSRSMPKEILGSTNHCKLVEFITTQMTPKYGEAINHNVHV